MWHYLIEQSPRHFWNPYVKSFQNLWLVLLAFNFSQDCARENSEPVPFTTYIGNLLDILAHYTYLFWIVLVNGHRYYVKTNTSCNYLVVVITKNAGYLFFSWKFQNFLWVSLPTKERQNVGLRAMFCLYLWVWNYESAAICCYMLLCDLTALYSTPLHSLEEKFNIFLKNTYVSKYLGIKANPH